MHGFYSAYIIYLHAKDNVSFMLGRVIWGEFVTQLQVFARCTASSIDYFGIFSSGIGKQNSERINVDVHFFKCICKGLQLLNGLMNVWGTYNWSSRTGIFFSDNIPGGLLLKLPAINIKLQIIRIIRSSIFSRVSF